MIVVDVVTELVMGVFSEMLHVDDVVMMSESSVGLRKKLRNQEALKSKNLNLTLEKPI